MFQATGFNMLLSVFLIYGEYAQTTLNMPLDGTSAPKLRFNTACHSYREASALTRKHCFLQYHMTILFLLKLEPPYFLCNCMLHLLRKAWYHIILEMFPIKEVQNMANKSV